MTGSVPKGGQQARRAAMLCQNKRFGLYLDHRRRQVQALEYRDLPDGTHTPEDCADFVRQSCGVDSRAAIDHNDAARAMLDRIAADYSKWERQQRMSERVAGGEV
ncbi:hypothetical protein [Vreelandella profundi]|uniref:hypothetical protein n=1 Tax=Vreelandella profundi TaxID=2852117 RepID=UPI001F2D1C80|nr:hypothetical protein [Halomonas profundi]